jgi:sporulation integral membrane protein YlbJ
MSRKIYTILIVFTILFVGLEILKESSSILSTVSFSLIIWENNVFPSLFPFFVISDLLINCGFASFLGELLKPFMYKLFRLNGESCFVLVLSMLSGFPSSAKITRDLYLKGLINDKEATKLLTFTHFSNPLFILGTISILFLNNKEVGFLILGCHYIGNFVVGLLFRNYYISKKDNVKVSLRRAINAMHLTRISNEKNFGQIVSGALINAVNTLLLILGVITMFLVITTVIDNNINLSAYNQTFMNGLLEMTQGLKYMSLLAIPLKNKAVLATLFISFGGLSVHMQTISIISDTKIKYFPFFVARILHASISSLLVFFLFDYYFSLC